MQVPLPSVVCSLSVKPPEFFSNCSDVVVRRAVSLVLSQMSCSSHSLGRTKAVMGNTMTFTVSTKIFKLF